MTPLTNYESTIFAQENFTTTAVKQNKHKKERKLTQFNYEFITVNKQYVISLIPSWVSGI